MLIGGLWRVPPGQTGEGPAYPHTRAECAESFSTFCNLSGLMPRTLHDNVQFAPEKFIFPLYGRQFVSAGHSRACNSGNDGQAGFS